MLFIILGSSVSKNIYFPFLDAQICSKIGHMTTMTGSEDLLPLPQLIQVGAKLRWIWPILSGAKKCCLLHSTTSTTNSTTIA